MDHTMHEEATHTQTGDAPQLLDVFICTFRRPELRRAVDSVLAAQVPGGMRVRITVVDNDDTPSGRPYIEDLIAQQNGSFRYLHAPGRNISIARNACFDAAEGDWIAFLDDDEIAEPDWLVHLTSRQQETGVDGVFGVTRSVFPDSAPDWMKELNIHSPGPQRNAGVVRAGGAGNVLLRWCNTPWVSARFDERLGRTGGEDTEFFYRIGRLGAQYEIGDNAVVFEPVTASRMSLQWLIKRRYRAGHTYAVSADSRSEKFRLATRAVVKSAISFSVTPFFLWSATKWRYWVLRGVFHTGVVAGCANLSQPESYG